MLSPLCMDEVMSSIGKLRIVHCILRPPLKIINRIHQKYSREFPKHIIDLTKIHRLRSSYNCLYLKSS